MAVPRAMDTAFLLGVHVMANALTSITLCGWGQHC